MIQWIELLFSLILVIEYLNYTQLLKIVWSFAYSGTLNTLKFLSFGCIIYYISQLSKSDREFIQTWIAYIWKDRLMTIWLTYG